MGQTNGGQQGWDIAQGIRAVAANVVVKHQRGADTARQIGYLVRVREAGAHAGVAVERENLGFVGQAAQWGAKQDAIIIALDFGAGFVGAGWGDAACGIFFAPAGIQKLHPLICVAIHALSQFKNGLLAVPWAASSLGLA